MTEEIYPMPFFPLLIVSDLETSSKFYQDVLGFKHIFPIPIYFANIVYGKQNSSAAHILCSLLAYFKEPILVL